MKLEKSKPRHQKTKRLLFHDESNVWGALVVLGITEDDINQGLVDLKRIAKTKYRKRVKISHPDMPYIGGVPSKGRSFNRQLDAYNRIKALKCVPITMENMDAVLEINKGYVSTSDVELPWEL